MRKILVAAVFAAVLGFSAMLRAQGCQDGAVGGACAGPGGGGTCLGAGQAGTDTPAAGGKCALAALGNRITCPVMGGQFSAARTTPRSEYKGKTYLFCCPGCKPQFDANPGKYVK